MDMVFEAEIKIDLIPMYFTEKLLPAFIRVRYIDAFHSLIMFLLQSFTVQGYL